MNHKYPFVTYPHLLGRYINRDFPELDIISEPIEPIKKEVSSDYKVILLISLYFARYPKSVFMRSNS